MTDKKEQPAAPEHEPLEDPRQARIDVAIAEYLECLDEGKAFNRMQWLDRYSDIRGELEAFLLDDEQLGTAFGIQMDMDAQELLPLLSLEDTLEFTNPLAIPVNPSGEQAVVSKTASKEGLSASVQPNANVAGYRLLRRLGVGGMGEVFEAQDAAGHRVAIKLLSSRLTSSIESMIRFKQEGEIAATINHPRCVFVKAANEFNGTPYIVMELMTGRTLRDMIEEQKSIPVSVAVEKILDVLDGLAEAHEHGMIHRDIKPANCYLEPNGRVKLGDFGLARSMLENAHLTTAGSFLGTPLYASPEQIRGDALDERTDIYSVCATLYYLLTGQAPFANSSATAVIAKIVAEDPVPPRQINPDIPLALEQIILKGLKRNRTQRYQSAQELAIALRPFVSGKQWITQLGRRAAAFGLDFLALAPLGLIWTMTLMTDSVIAVPPLWVYLLIAALPTFLYSFVCESIWRATLGKWVMGLQVSNAETFHQASGWKIALRALSYTALVGTVTDIAAYCAIDSTPENALLFAFLQSSGYLVSYLLMLLPLLWTRGRQTLHDLLSSTVVVETHRTPKKASVGKTIPAWKMQIEPDSNLPASCGPFEIHGRIGRVNDGDVLLAEDASLSRTVWLWWRGSAEAPVSISRQQCDRTSRLRWLNGGNATNHRWDAFLAAKGAPITHWCHHSSPYSWSMAARVLQQLMHEINQWQPDSTVAIRSIDQVWLDSRGRICLLDAPLSLERQNVATNSPSSNSHLNHEDKTSHSPIALLREVTRLMLTGNSRPLGDTPQQIDAVLPMNARKIVDKLATNQLETDELKTLEQQVVESMNRPNEVTLVSRVAMMGICVASLGLFVGSMFSMSRLGNQIAMSKLRDVMIWNHALGEISSDPKLAEEFLRACPPDSRKLDQTQLRELTDNYHDSLKAAYELRFANASEIGRTIEVLDAKTQHPFASLGELKVERVEGDTFTVEVSNGFLETPVRVRMEQFQQVIDTAPNSDLKQLLKRPLWPIVAITLAPAMVVMLWAGLSRGGIPMFFVDVKLANRKGQPARWWQHVLRSFLAWMPFLAILGVISVADLYMPEQSTLILVLSYVLLYLPAVYAIIALVSPKRGPHDWILGTWLVPN